MVDEYVFSKKLRSFNGYLRGKFYLQKDSVVLELRLASFTLQECSKHPWNELHFILKILFFISEAASK